MAKQLKTEWKRIGRSGPTVDGRTIEPSALEQAAKNYRKDLFTALVWPDHLRWFNMGTVEELRSERNSEGGIDLFAIVAPNEYYQSINASGQRLFTSMELMPNFRETGEFYLTGLAATDTPASAATSEMRFSSIKNKDALISTFIENTPGAFPDDDQPPSWFKRLFTTDSNEDAMSKQALEALSAKFTALEQKLDAIVKPGGQSDENDNSGQDQSGNTEQDYAALADSVKQLSEQFTALEAKLAGGKDGKTDQQQPDQFKQLADELKQLREDFTKAVNEANGTDAGEHTGGKDDASNYL